MAYDPNKIQLTHILQDAYKVTGMSRRWKVTGGSNTTVINNAWAGIEDARYEDNDAALINGTAIVQYDAGGAGASPEGEYSRISTYDATSQTITLSETLTGGVASGDRVVIASPAIPLEDMIETVNVALKHIGDFDLIDTSVQSVGGASEYTMPAAIRQRPLRVQIQTNQSASNNLWLDVNFDVRPATAGANWTLIIPEQIQGYVLSIKYRILHPRMTAFDSYLLDTIHPDLATAAVAAHSLEWMNNNLGGTSDYWIQRENKAWQDYEVSRVMFPVEKEVGQVMGMPHWKNRNRYPYYWQDMSTLC